MATFSGWMKFTTTVNSGWGYALALLLEAEHGNSQTQTSENVAQSHSPV